MEKNLFDALKVVLLTYHRRFLLGFLTMLIANTLLIFNPLVFRQAVAAFDTSSIETSGPIAMLFGQHQILWVWVVVLSLIAATSSFFKYLMRVTFITVSRDVEQEVRLKIFGKIQNQSMAFFDRYGIGELLSRLTNDISSFRDVLGPGIMYPLFFFTIVIPGLSALFYLSPPLALVSLTPLIIIPLVNQLLRKRIYQMSKEEKELLGKMSDLTQEHFSANRIVKCYGKEEETREQFRQLAERVKGVNFRLAFLQGILFPIFLLVTKLTTVAIVLTSAWLIISGVVTLSSADFLSFMWVQSYIFFPILMMGWLFPVYERGRAAYERLVTIYHEPIEVVDTKDGVAKIPLKASIEVHNLSFTYPTQESPTLEGLSFKIKGGEFVGITGPTGGGKSTLIKLLSREYEVPRGKILVAERDVHEYSLQAFYSAAVTVEQIPFLFSKTVAENISFGEPKASQERIEEVAQYADFHENVLTFPEQYETMVGERGMTLSGGQKQRLSMARAFLVDRSILLLDDVFSAVDFATEERIFRLMQEKFVGKTLLLVTHRISLLQQLDHILYIDKGKVLEEGSHDALMQRNGHYAALVELQQWEESHG